ncbi:Protein HOS4 [Diplonema papillatum]|nr:Protein HOS4 [Diplonema papillatum]|eukprot:gene16886-25893_t
MPPKGKAKSGKAKHAPKPAAKKGASTTSSTSAAAAKLNKALGQSDAVLAVQRVGHGGMARGGMADKHSELAAAVLQQMEDAARLKRKQFEKKRREAELKQKHEAKTKAQLEAQLQDKLFTAAFDGELDELKSALQEGADIHKPDHQSNYCVGEAAVNGQTEAVALLLKAGADPNCLGAYGRTPLWRAAYNGHKDTATTLLEHGGDPRIVAQAQTPEELATGDLKLVLAGWDTARTDAMLARLEQAKQTREQTRLQQAELLAKPLDDTAAEARRRYENAKKKLAHLRCDLERRIHEYDCIHLDPDKGEDMRNIGLDLVKTAEKAVDEAISEAEALEHEYLDAKGRALAHRQLEMDEEEIGHAIKLNQLYEVVFADQLGKHRSWPLVIDHSGRSSVFVRYRDTNYLSTMHPQQMQPESIRRAVLGALRYGKPLVLDLHDVPLLEHAVGFFNAVEDGLWEKVVSKSIVREFRSLLRDSDGPEYEARNFVESNLEQFLVVVLTSSRVIEEPLLIQFVPFRVCE